MLHRRHSETLPKRLAHLLKKDGRILVVEWRKVPTLFGPLNELRFEEEEMVSLFEQNDFSLHEGTSAGIYHYGLIFAHKTHPLLQNRIAATQKGE